MDGYKDNGKLQQCCEEAGQTKAMFAGYEDVVFGEAGGEAAGGEGQRVSLLKKRVLRSGRAGEYAEKGGVVSVHVVARQGKDRTRIIFSSRDVVEGKSLGGADVVLRFELLRMDDEEEDEFVEDESEGALVRGLPRGLHFGVAKMELGEVAELVVLHPSMGWMSAEARGTGRTVLARPELEREMEADGFLPLSVMEVELVGFEAPLPRFPSRKALDVAREEQEQEERKRARDFPPPSVTSRMENAAKARVEGNELFKEGKFEEAKGRYDTAFVHLFYTAEEWQAMVSESEQREIQECRRILHLNRAICKIKMGDSESAEWDCDKAIEIGEEIGIEKDPRPYYRRGLVYLDRLKSVLKKEKEGKFWDIDRAREIYDHAMSDLQSAKAALPAQKQQDKGLENLESELALCNKWLEKYARNYARAEAKMIRERMFKGVRELEKKQSNGKALSSSQKEKEKVEEEEEEDIPELEE